MSLDGVPPRRTPRSRGVADPTAPRSLETSPNTSRPRRPPAPARARVAHGDVVGEHRRRAVDARDPSPRRAAVGALRDPRGQADGPAAAREEERRRVLDREANGLGGDALAHDAPACGVCRRDRRREGEGHREARHGGRVVRGQPPSGSPQGTRLLTQWHRAQGSGAARGCAQAGERSRERGAARGGAQAKDRTGAPVGQLGSAVLWLSISALSPLSLLRARQRRSRRTQSPHARSATSYRRVTERSRLSAVSERLASRAPPGSRVITQKRPAAPSPSRRRSPCRRRVVADAAVVF